MHFELYVDKAGKWRFRLRAENGKIVAHGQSYPQKDDCLAVIALIKTAAKETPVQELVTKIVSR